MEAPGGGDAGPATAERTVDFGWEDDAPLGGRRLKQEREKKRKLKPGSFGACLALVLQPPCTLVLQPPRLAVPYERWRGRRDEGPERGNTAWHQAQGLPPADPHPAPRAAAGAVGAGRGGHGAHWLRQDGRLCRAAAGEVRPVRRAPRPAAPTAGLAAAGAAGLVTRASRCTRGRTRPRRTWQAGAVSVSLDSRCENGARSPAGG